MSVQPLPAAGPVPMPGAHLAVQTPAARKGGVRIVDAVKIYGAQDAGHLGGAQCR